LSTFIFSAGIAISGQFEALFRYEVFKMLKAEGKITNCGIENMRNNRLKPTLEKSCSSKSAGSGLEFT
jgi:hypothetical protein